MTKHFMVEYKTINLLKVRLFSNTKHVANQLVQINENKQVCCNSMYSLTFNKLVVLY